MAIFNPPHERTAEAQRLVGARAAQTGEGGPAANLDETIDRWFTEHLRKHGTETIDRIRNWVFSTDPLIYTQCRQVLANGVIELIRPNPGIDKPTFVMTCENDTGGILTMNHAIAAEIPGSETLIVPDR